MTAPSSTDANDQPAVPFYDAIYGRFDKDVYREIRRGVWGDDFGQNSWITAAEQDRFLEWCAVGAQHRLLDVACGSGGPAVRIAERTGAAVTGVDVHADGIAAARNYAAARNLAASTTFVVHDAGRKLEFADASFDVLVCIDAINHLPDRPRVLADWCRVLRPGGSLVFTDPIVVTGPLTAEEIAIRASIGFFQFVPRETNPRLLAEAGFEVRQCEDLTPAVAEIAGSWHRQRKLRSTDLLRLEGEQTYKGQQRFLEVACRLARERRLSRFAYFAIKTS
ncbi:MAG: methyltransferase domain-containing protein [Phycisphaerales bacterium]|nr:methyltransferase domain-containing protein [Phycisphaerales bacterium]